MQVSSDWSTHDRFLFPALVSFRQMDRQGSVEIPIPTETSARNNVWGTNPTETPGLPYTEDSHKDNTVAVISSDESRL